jgi:hydrogenase/urease accessory protein HupE
MSAGGAGLLSGFLAGLINPLVVTAHLAALLGLGLMVGQQMRRGATLIAFALGLAAGLAALASATGETPANTVLLAAMAVTGLAVASGWPVPPAAGMPVALVVGVCVGLDSPPRFLSIQAANAALVGTAAGAVVLVGLIAAITARLGRGWPGIGVRVLGSWVTASAILALALRLAR